LTKPRLAKLAALLQAADLPAAAFVPGPNFYYLTGVHLHLMERPTILIVTADGKIHAAIPALERDRWNSSVPEAETVYWQDSDGYAGALETLARRTGLRRLGVEAGRMRHFEAMALESAFGFKVTDASNVLAQLRLIKEPGELAAMEHAIRISEQALEDTLPQIVAGMFETEIRARLHMAMLERGADGAAFDLIVLAGAASADCHGVPSPDRRVAKGQALLFDWGAAAAGYSADLTRTFFVETVSDLHRDIYQTVLDANRLGHALVAPGTTYDALDAAVQTLLRERGYADMIRHKTGHGLGLDIHEAPQVMVGNNAAMAPGTVFTIEPGLYRPDDVGVRIEDDVVVTDAGGRSLSTMSRELRIIG
jgi:Xaa-Pro aminopeptidase